MAILFITSLVFLTFYKTKLTSYGLTTFHFPVVSEQYQHMRQLDVNQRTVNIFIKVNQLLDESQYNPHVVYLYYVRQGRTADPPISSCFILVATREATSYKQTQMFSKNQPTHIWTTMYSNLHTAYNVRHFTMSVPGTTPDRCPRPDCIAHRFSFIDSGNHKDHMIDVCKKYILVYIYIYSVCIHI